MATATDTAKEVFIGGRWRSAESSGSFQAIDPSKNAAIEKEFPVSSWSDIDAALDAAVEAWEELRRTPPAKIAEFLEAYADAIDAAKAELAEVANRETALPVSPRLADVEIPRTSNQLRLAAKAARDGSWALPTIDTAAGIRSVYRPLGPVAVFGPNNFPFAFNSVAGGDFAAAIAAGNPVIGKANSSHPDTTRMLAELAVGAVEKVGLPASTVQLIYRTGHADGERLVSDPRIGATGYTGARTAGLKLKSAADKAGKPIYLELSSVNPVVATAGALSSKRDAFVDDFLTSVLMGTGQFCTNPGLVILPAGDDADATVKQIAGRFDDAAVGTLLGPNVAKGLSGAIEKLVHFGATLVTGGGEPHSDRCAVANTLLTVSGQEFLENPEGFQTEAFGNASLIVLCDDVDQMVAAIGHLEGNLTGCVYSADDGSEESDVDRLMFALEPKVGRLLNDKMPTGVAVSAAMNHGGPYPATGHPGFTAVGVPGSLLRFGKLTSFDNVRADRLPEALKDENPMGGQRLVDGRWTDAAVG